ncbi:MAG: hypothetical protein ACR2PS_06895 [Pseudomonadales bacterium]
MNARQHTVAVTVLFLVWLTILSAAQAQVYVSPKISLLSGDGELKPNVSHTVTVEVIDDTGVTVTLFYRAIGSLSEFRSMGMTSMEDSLLYSATLPADDIEKPGLEYYVQAIDRSHNISELDPLKVYYASGNPPNRWVWVALGALAVGAVAALAGSGSSSGSDSGADVVVTAPTSPVTQ